MAAFVIGALPERRRADGAAIQNQIRDWIALHPASHVDLAPAPPQPWTEEQLSSEIAVLQQAVETLLRDDPRRPFTLGEPW